MCVFIYVTLLCVVLCNLKREGLKGLGQKEGVMGLVMGRGRDKDGMMGLEEGSQGRDEA